MRRRGSARSRRPPAFWFDDCWLSRLLAPLAWVFRAAVALRRRWWRGRAIDVGVPVIVVGGLIVGGSGKTPLVVHIVELARRRGYTPGVVLRGYRGEAREWPRDVDNTTDPLEVGDEAVLIAQRTGAPVVAAPDRVAAARRLGKAYGCDLVLADDGLQHYRLARQAEIVVIDAARGLGNGRCLPAGPLREPRSRLEHVTAVIGNGAPPSPYGEAWFELVADSPRPVNGAVRHGVPPTGGDRIHGVAGIGDPERAFRTFEALGFGVFRHPFGDHHRFTATDLEFADALPVVMTEKDAVKCRALDRGQLWYLPVRVHDRRGCGKAIEEMLDGLRPSRGRAELS